MTGVVTEIFWVVGKCVAEIEDEDGRVYVHECDAGTSLSAGDRVQFDVKETANALMFSTSSGLITPTVADRSIPEAVDLKIL